MSAQLADLGVARSLIRVEEWRDKTITAERAENAE
jgi:hypothetical protein